MSAELAPYLPINHVFVDLENVRTDKEAERMIEELIEAGYLQIDGKGAVTYHLGG